MKKVIYTSIVGNYDTLLEYPAIDESFDYICFCENCEEGSKVGHWTLKNIPYDLDNPVRKSRYVKLLPHKVLKDYDYSVWLDGNIAIASKYIYDQIHEAIENHEKWKGIHHYERKCIYKEARQCIWKGKGDWKEIVRGIRYLKKNNFPEEYGLFENNFILRKHNDPEIIQIDEEWWKLYSEFSERDQLILFYLFWKYGFTPGAFEIGGFRLFESDDFIYQEHNGKRKNFLFYFYRKLLIRMLILTKVV